jgi:membrane-bound inhibitor of C-type lysozyme
MLRTLALCDTGETVELRFFPDVGVAVLVRDGATTELQAMPSGSGFRYEGNGLTVTGKGSEIRIDGAGTEPLVCTATPGG